jgi:ribosome-binding protein aMBF1 (putative translation factor)
MRDLIDQECPLCGTGASYYSVDYDRRKYFRCPKCTKYQITVRAEERVRAAPQQWRDQLSRQANQASADELLVIRMPTVSEQRESSEGLHVSFVSKKELPL